ncbi:helix-turn-helix domain-containing protein [Paenibacillus sp. RC67]|uniref:helix-turn-helix domain-containing protein n=1 Tax=Paenibacillus sp. RC67 TaxID=3039392 RepID=UPI0024AD499F|nr:helix-turn-helix domain-containing protein [Paenibacillus sp. RC67]
MDRTILKPLFDTIPHHSSAKRLLMDTPLSVTEIAAFSGFGDLSHFFHTFKTEAGITPNAFRKQCAGDSQHKVNPNE